MNVRLTKSQRSVFSEILSVRCPIVLHDRQSGSTFLMCYYAAYKAMTQSDRRIVILCHCERTRRTILQKLGDIIGVETSPMQEYISINGSKIYCASCVNSDRLRGLRPHDILVHDYENINKEVFETFCTSFTAVSTKGADDQFIIFGNNSFYTVKSVVSSYLSLSNEQDDVFDRKYSVIELRRSILEEKYEIRGEFDG